MSLFFTFYEARSTTVVPLNQIPNHLEYAVIAMEDKDFYSHPGFSPKAIVRSFIENMRSGETRYGGSTITQQLVKNALLTPERDYVRKYQEVVLAQEIERRFTKDEILEMYLNSVYFGEGAFGVVDASMRYFGKQVNDLTLAESTMLVALLPSPSQLSPVNGNGEEARIRQHIILEKMLEQGYITQEEKSQAENTTLSFVNGRQDVNSLAPHFAIMVRDELIAQYGEEFVARSGFKVRTTLNRTWQEFAEETVSTHVASIAHQNVSNGAIVAIDPKTGAVQALVGSRDWFDNSYGKVNVATSLRQPGSSFKPIIYAAAFEKQIITPGTILNDKPITYARHGQVYEPKNYDSNFRGTVLPRRALANSLNVPAVEVMDKLGVEEALTVAKRFGITTLGDSSNYGLSLVLGSGEVKLLELTNTYATFANQGVYNKPFIIHTITDKSNRIVYQHTPKPRRVLDAKYAYIITSILSDQQARTEAFGNGLTTPFEAAVKTGTTEYFRDALTLGYTPHLTVGVWIGNNDGSPMHAVAGSLGAAPLWKSLMERFLQDLPSESFQEPDGIVTLTVCKHNGLITKQEGSFATQEVFAEGTQPDGECIVTPTPKTEEAKPPETKPQEQEEKQEDNDEEDEKKNNGDKKDNGEENARNNPPGRQKRSLPLTKHPSTNVFWASYLEIAIISSSDKSSTFFSQSIDAREKKNDANLRGKPRGFEKVLDKRESMVRGLQDSYMFLT